MTKLLVTTCLLVCAEFNAAVPIGNDVETENLDLSYVGDALIGSPSDETGRKLLDFDPESEVNPEELGEYFEGDILFPNGRNGLIAEVSHWEDGVIPYEIAGSFSQKDLNMISDAMDAYHQYTCLRFKPRIASDVDYIVLNNANTGCWSSVGKIGGRQEVNLQSPGCFSKVGTPIHELMHAAGFMHEQNRFERDDNVDIIWPNIQSGRDNNFKKVDDKTITGFGVPYDYNSVMHYSEKAFSKNGRPTIVAKRSGDLKMGQRDGFSKGDIKKIRKMYACKDRDEEVPPKASNGVGGILGLFLGK